MPSRGVPPKCMDRAGIDPAMPPGHRPTVLCIEVVYALAGEQALVSLEVKPGTTVQQAIERSRIAERFPGQDLRHNAVGVWGRCVNGERLVEAGDRIEIYRELVLDPREARRRLADSGKVMGPQ